MLESDPLEIEIIDTAEGLVRVEIRDNLDRTVYYADLPEGMVGTYLDQIIPLIK